MSSSITSGCHPPTSSGSESPTYVNSPGRGSLLNAPFLPRSFVARIHDLDIGSRRNSTTHPTVRSVSCRRFGSIASLPESRSALTCILPPPLDSKEIYRLKTSWKSGLETHNSNSFKEAGLDTIIRCRTFYSTIWRFTIVYSFYQNLIH